VALNQPVKAGLSAPVVTSIPAQWSAQWFRGFITNFLQNADVRNASTPGSVAVTGNPATQATVTLTAAAEALITAIQSIADDTVLGNVSGAVGVPAPLTRAQVTTLVNSFTATLSGAVPASGGGTTTVLRADGTFAAAVTGAFGVGGALTVGGALGVNGAAPPAQVTGFGTPTGTGVIANFSGSAATLAQCSETIAEILTILKANGVIGA
jgi:hypothetical protein